MDTVAERRMFAKTIVDSDAFLDMPLSTQSLYFHLSMRADDEGFINNPKKIQRMLGCADDDLKLLIAKKFIIPFESGVVVIKHWKIHNYIRKDRLQETVYQDEKELLDEKENGSYTLCRTDVSQVSANCQPNDGIGKDRLGKDSIGEDRVVEHIPYQELVNLFNDTCTSLPKVRQISDSRKKKIKFRWKELKCIEAFEALFYRVEQSDFLTGKTGWKASFDWLMENDKNYLKVIEGNYDNKKKEVDVLDEIIARGMRDESGRDCENNEIDSVAISGLLQKS